MHRYGIKPHKTETIEAARFDTGWKPSIMTVVITGTDNAIAAIQNDSPDVKVFTDGSGMEGKIGAAAVLYRNGNLKTKLRYQLRSQQHHTVYEGEGIGAVLGTKLISKEWNIRSANIYIDNCASITATQLTKPNPGHYIFDALHKSIAVVRKRHRGIKITVKWVPGHKGIEGNEQADEEVKKAIMEGSNEANRLLGLLKKMLPCSNSPTCPACQQSKETIQHFILHCTAHQAARQTLRNSIGGRNIDVTRILTSPKSLRALFKYVAETGHLNSTFWTLPEMREKEEDRSGRGGR
jgi:ribonuclease HI